MESFVERLARLDACAISDALDRLGLSGAVAGIVRLSTDRRISGRVLTVKLEKDDGRPAASRHLGTTAVEAAQPGDVIVVEQRTGVDAAGWGGNLSLGAKVRGVAGVVVEGPARDVDEGRQHDFPVFARSHTARTARGRLVEVGTNVSITVGDVAVEPGDYVVADGTAVVFVGARDIARVLDAADAIAGREQAMAEALRAGTPIGEVMDKRYETMLKQK
jgi:regulator of RNase E activity RraA